MEHNELFFLWIPFLPPGINSQYTRSRGTGRVILTLPARIWKDHAAVMIGARAGELLWEQTSDKYAIEIYVVGTRADADAYIKTVIDTVTKKLGFDDKLIVRLKSGKMKLPDVKEMYLRDDAQWWAGRGLDGSEFGVERYLNAIRKATESCFDNVRSGIYVRLYPVEGR